MFQIPGVLTFQITQRPDTVRFNRSVLDSNQRFGTKDFNYLCKSGVPYPPWLK
jgi:hypothetical protein